MCAQGLKIRKPTGRPTTPINEIVEKLAATTGLATSTVKSYLSDDFKQTEYARTKDRAKIPASERIEHELGKDYVERHREEVLAEERPKIEKEVAEKLLTDEHFLTEVAKVSLPTEPSNSHYSTYLTVSCGKDSLEQG